MTKIEVPKVEARKIEARKIEASVFIITLNEQAHIGRALKSVADFAQIIVVDSGSTDKTVQIARQHGAKIVHHDFESFAAQKNYALGLCSKAYALALDADEQASPALLAEICRFLQNPDTEGLIIPRFDMVLGKPPHPWTHAQRQIRFFRTKAAHYAPTLVHESIHIKGPVRRTKNGINHYGDNTIEQRLGKIKSYAWLRAQEKHAAKKRPNRLKLIMVGPLIFIKTYIIRRYFLNGWRGFIISALNGHYAFLKEAFLYEKWTIGPNNDET